MPERWSGRSTAMGTSQRTTPPRRRGPGRRARRSGPGVKEWVAKVDGAATWPTDAVPADDAKEEAADGTAGAGRLFGILAAVADGGR